MIHIKYRLDRSQIHGIGLFADQDVKKGDTIFTDEPLLDVNITEKQFTSLNKSTQKEILYWGYFDKQNQKWHVDFDHIHFINHSFNPNMTQDMTRSDVLLVSSRDIRAGEELTQNYLEFENEDDLIRRGINIKN